MAGNAGSIGASPGAVGAIRVDGLDALIKAFRAVDKALVGDLKDALAEAAAPVRAEAQYLAGTEISHMKEDSPWRLMRTGFALGERSVYVAPVERGVKSKGLAKRKRREFFDVLLGKALEPALDHNITQVEGRIDEMLGELQHLWERVR